MITSRTQLPGLVPVGSIAAELGVAAGAFSLELLASGRLSRLYSIDRWSDHHDHAEEQQARALLARFGAASVVMRSTFADALPLIPDASLDLLYIDGYAHTGQDGGRTLRDWLPKVKAGGIIAGHDYDPAWRPTIDAVDAFVRDHGLALNIIPAVPGAVCNGDRYASWWARVPA